MRCVQWRSAVLQYSSNVVQKAIAYAKSAFPEDLRPIPASQLSLTVLSNTPRGKRTVYISPMAWNAVSNNLATYEIIDIVVKPPVIVLNDNQEPELPPDYDDLCMPDTKTPYSYPYPNDASPKSRRPSPGRRSPSPSAKSGVKGWLERVLP